MVAIIKSQLMGAMYICPWKDEEVWTTRKEGKAFIPMSWWTRENVAVIIAGALAFDGVGGLTLGSDELFAIQPGQTHCKMTLTVARMPNNHTTHQRPPPFRPGIVM